jgi:hypothetical protein
LLAPILLTLDELLFTLDELEDAGVELATELGDELFTLDNIELLLLLLITLLATLDELAPIIP